jgi:hypothetical protein
MLGLEIGGAFWRVWGAIVSWGVVLRLWPWSCEDGRRVVRGS